MLESSLKEAQNSIYFGNETHHTDTSISFDFQQILSRSTHSINQYERQIIQLESSLKKQNINQEGRDVSIDQAHFWFKKKVKKGEGEIVIQSQYLQDSVFDNIYRQNQEQLDKMFIEAKAEIDRLTGILIERDNQIAYLKNQGLGFNTSPQVQRRQDAMNTEWDIKGYMEEYERIKGENRKLEVKIKQLSEEVKNSRKDQEESRRRSTTNVVRISANRPSVKEIGSLTSSGVSLVLKQKRAVEVQTQNNNSMEILNELNYRRGEVDHLRTTIEVLNQQFQSLKNDNFLFVEDLEKGKVRIEELQKIVQVQNEHIQVLRKQGADNLKVIVNKQDTKEKSNNVLPNSIDDSDSVKELRSIVSNLSNENNILKQKLQEFDKQIEIIAIRNEELQSILMKVKQENKKLASQKLQLQSRITNQLSEQQLTVKNNEQLIRKTVNLEAQVLSLIKGKDQIILEKQLLANKMQQQETQWNVIRMKLQKQASKPNVIKPINVKSEVDQKTVQILRAQLKEKSKFIEDLQRREKDLEKSISAYKNEIGKNNGGVVAFGTSNSISDKSPEKLLLQIQTTDELVDAARELLRNKSNNLQKVYAVLDLLTEEFQLLREELFKTNRDNHNTSVYQQETNSYIETLLQKIADHEIEEERLFVQNNKLRGQVDRMNLLYRGQDYKDWEDLLNELQFERKLTEKLSDHVKTLKEQIFNISAQLTKKNEELYILSNRVYKSKWDAREIDIHLGSIQSDYSKLISNSRSRNHQYESFDIPELLDEIELYRLELQKAINLNQQLRECLMTDKSCKECQEYQVIVEDLQAKVNHYEKMMMGEMRKIFNSCEKQISKTKGNNIQARIENLKQKTNVKYSEKGFEKSKVSGSPSVKKYTQIVPRSTQKTDLKNLIEEQKMTLEAMLILMHKVIVEADNQKLYMQRDPILPDHIEISNYNRMHPENMRVHIVQSIEGANQKSKLYLSPERLKGCEPTRKSLIWNIGIIFHLLVNKKPFFNSELEILENSYRYENKLLPELKPIIQNMLQKQASRRKLFSQIQAMANNQLSRLKILRSRN